MTAALERSESLHARARAWVHGWRAGGPGPSLEELRAFAVDLARHQAEAIPGVARLMKARGVPPRDVRSAPDVPAVPTDAFKMTDLSAFPVEATPYVFRTSGTTVGARGVHRIRDIGTYDVASCAFGRRYLARDLREKMPVLVLGPSPAEANDSSLTHMIGLFVAEFGEPAAREETYFLRDGKLDSKGLLRRVAKLKESDAPALVLGTSFAFVHLLDELGERAVALPRGSRLMQTGGYKGRSREVPADELRAALGVLFSISPQSIVSEYGMTELSSQFYEATIWDALPHGTYVEPPWARVVPVDPETLLPVAEGELGIARIEDLLNIDSPFVVQTQDLVRRVPGGFELHGRAKGATPRGCSIAIDELLAG